MKCPHPSYVEDYQMICNCNKKDCDPANGCNITSKGTLHVFLIAFFLVFLAICSTHISTYVKFGILSLILGYPVTSFMGLEDKIVTTELLNYEASISDGKYHFDLFYPQNV